MKRVVTEVREKGWNLREFLLDIFSVKLSAKFLGGVERQ